MIMTNEDIVRSYKDSKDKNKQIGILADLNVCDRQTIIDVLRDAKKSVDAGASPMSDVNPTADAATTANAIPDPGALAAEETKENAVLVSDLFDRLLNIYDDVCSFEGIENICYSRDSRRIEINGGGISIIARVGDCKK